MRAGDRQVLRDALRAGPGCLNAAAFERALNQEEAAHLAGCPRCQTQFAMYREYEAAEPAPGEGAAVQWIAAELKRRNLTAQAAAAAPGWWTRRTAVLGTRRFAGVLAALTIALGVSTFVLDRRTGITLPEGAGSDVVYRSDNLELVAPSGDLNSIGSEFRWKPLARAARYDVEVLEVDRTVLWQSEAQTGGIAVPAAVRARALPGKTLLWRVTAKDSANRVIAESPLVSFRVKTKPIPQGE
jgi:hypothetical protein